MDYEQRHFLRSSLASLWMNLAGRKRPVKKILVIKLDEIGDMVYALHVFDHLREAFPDAKQTLWCKPFVVPLVEHHPAISSIINRQPDDTDFDIIVELRGDPDTLSFARLCKPWRYVCRGTVRIKNKLSGGQKHEILTNFEIIQPLLPGGTALRQPVIYIADEVIGEVDIKLGKTVNGPFAVLHCGARKKLRQWSPSNFRALAVYLHQRYALQVVFAGTPEDEGVIGEICHCLEVPYHLFTRDFSLSHFAALCKRASVFVGNESGPLHIAALSGIPVVGLYGPGVKDVFYPAGNKSRVVHHILPCNPCDQEHCVRPESPCIDLITLDEVQSAVDSLLKAKGS